MMPILRLLVAVSFCLIASPAVFAFSGGSGAGVRGGGVAVWIDGRWSVKDVFQTGSRAGAPMALSGKLRDLIDDEVRPLVEMYTGSERSTYWEKVLDDAAEYRLVDRLPCPHTDERLEANEANFGCTIGETTYFNRKIFLAFDNATKVLAILHERGHALDPSESAHDWIVPFVDGVRVLLALAHEQERGRWRRVDADELKILDRLANDAHILRWMAVGASSNGLPRVRMVTAQGGGVILSDEPLRRMAVPIDETSFIGVGSALDVSYSTCRYGNEVVESTHWVFNHSRIENSIVQCHALLLSQVVNSKLTYEFYQFPKARFNRNSLGVLDRSRIEGSSVHATAPNFFSFAVVRSSKIVYRGLRKGVISRSKLTNISFQTPEALLDPTERMGFQLFVQDRDLIYPKKTMLESNQMLVPYYP